MDLRDKFSSLAVSPQKILKIVIGLSLVLLLMWLFTLSRIDQRGEQGSSIIASGKQDNTAVIKDKAASESQGVGPYGESGSGDMFSGGLLTFGVLLVILMGVWYWLDRKEAGSARDVQREIGSHILGERAQLKILQINGEVWVLGVTAETVNLLHRYPKSEWTETNPDELKAEGDKFSKIFRKKLG